MIPLSILFSFIIIHWVADFMCQTDWMAINKRPIIYFLNNTCMGVFKMFSTSSFERCRDRRVYADTPAAQELPNPNPNNYKILHHEQVGDVLVIEINYPDCKNYEGNKILVFLYCTLDKLQKQKKIDPHFSNNPQFHSPFARFEPTPSGWQAALIIANTLK